MLIFKILFSTLTLASILFASLAQKIVLKPEEDFFLNKKNGRKINFEVIKRLLSSRFKIGVNVDNSIEADHLQCEYDSTEVSWSIFLSERPKGLIGFARFTHELGHYFTFYPIWFAKLVSQTLRPGVLLGILLVSIVLPHPLIGITYGLVIGYLFLSTFVIISEVRASILGYKILDKYLSLSKNGKADVVLAYVVALSTYLVNPLLLFTIMLFWK